jgi:hypothetical protein
LQMRLWRRVSRAVKEAGRVEGQSKAAILPNLPLKTSQVRGLLGPWALLPAEFSSERSLAPTGLGGPPPLYSCKPLESTFFRLSAHTSAQAAQLVCSTLPILLPCLTTLPELQVTSPTSTKTKQHTTAIMG